MRVSAVTPIRWDEHGEGTPVVFLHGFTVDHRSLLGIGEEVFGNREHWRRIYVDLPGMGQSVAGPDVRSTDDVARTVAAFVDEVTAGERYAVIGNSFGGAIARYLVGKGPGRVLGMALLAPMVVADRARRQLPARVVLEPDPDVLARMSADARAEFADVAVLQTREVADLFETEILPGLRAADQAALARIGEAYALAAEPESLFETFDRPVAILTGRQDIIAGYADSGSLLESYPHATLAVLDRAGHNLHHEQRGLSADLLSEWVDRVEAALAI